MSFSSPDRAAKARQVFSSRFASPEEKSAYYAELAKLSARRRLILDQHEAAALRVAVDILTRALTRLEARDAT